MRNAAKWEAVKVNSRMWNVYKDDDTAGVIVWRDGDWIAINYQEHDHAQRTGRPSAYQAAKDMWGPDAGEAVA